VDRTDLINAIHAIGRAPEGERFSVKRWIVYRAEILNLKALVPADWKGEVHDAIHGTGRSQLQAAKARRDRLRAAKGVAAPPQACKACGGTGRLNGRVCYLCLGAGRVKSFSAPGGTAAPGGQEGVGAGSTGGSTAI
jgi:hypothetical protein